MTGKQLYERAQLLGLKSNGFTFSLFGRQIQEAWNQLAKEASVNVADELGSSMQHERFGG